MGEGGRYTGRAGWWRRHLAGMGWVPGWRRYRSDGRESKLVLAGYWTRTEMVPSVLLATARPGRPLELKSPTTSE